MNKKDNASLGATGANVAWVGAKAAKKSKVFECSADYIRNFVVEIRAAGLQLRSTAADTQLATLPKLLQYLGPRGLSTYEGTAAGYLRIATRIKELKETWEIHSLREDVIGPDGLFHKGVARYVLLGKKKQADPSQLNLGLEGA